MSPFFFLATRRINNGIRRSFRTPVRGMMTVLLSGYFLFSFAAFFFSKTTTPRFITGIPDMDLHIVTSILVFVHFLFFTISILRPKYAFTILSETDVENIYPTPRKTWSVIRYFLFTRSFPLIFLFTSLMGIYLFKILQMFVRIPTSSHHGWMASLSLSIYIVLLMLTLSAVLFWRLVIDIRQEFGLIHKYLFQFSLVVIFGIVLFSAVYHIQESLRGGRHPLIGLTESADSFPVLFILFPFQAFANLLTGPYDILNILCSFLFWSVLSFTGYRALRAEEPRLYEYAAHTAALRALMKDRLRNPATAIKAARAKSKQSLFPPLLFRIFTPKRSAAIFWKDGIVAWRSHGRLIKGVTAFLVLFIIGTWIFTQFNPIRFSSNIFRGISIIGMVMILMFFCLSSITIFSETLKRTEVQKPLPVSALQTVSMHILLWTVMTWMVIVIPYGIAALLFPAYASLFLFVLMGGCTFSYVINSGLFFVVLFNPDMQDPLQRMYVPLFGMALSVVVSAPAILVLVIGFILHVHLLIILCLVILCNLGGASVLHILSSRKYKNFLYSE
jgi:hypothetical protein